MKTFTYQSKLYIRVIPTKRLFNSTTIHEVVNRGDIFAVRVEDSVLTIIPGTALVEHSTHDLTVTEQAAKASKSIPFDFKRYFPSTSVSTNSKI